MNHPRLLIVPFVAFVLSAGTWLSLPVHIHAATKATLSLSTPASTADASGYISTNIILSTTDPASAVSIKLNATGLKFADATYTNSIFDTELKTPVDTDSGVTISRVRLDKGYTGTDGVVATLQWQPTALGKATISIDQSNSTVIGYNDQSNILGSVSGTDTTITSLPTITTNTTTAQSPATMTDTNVDESGMNMHMSNNDSHRTTVLDYVRYTLLIIGIILVAFSLINWRRLRTASKKTAVS